MKISEQLRKHIEDSPLSRHRLCRLARMNPANLAQFMAGHRGMSLESLDALGEVLGASVKIHRAAVRALAMEAPKAGRPGKSERKRKVKNGQRK